MPNQFNNIVCTGIRLMSEENHLQQLGGFRATMEKLENLEKVSFLRKLGENLEN